MKHLLSLVFLFLAVAGAKAEDISAHYYVPPGQLSTQVQVMEGNVANIFGMFGNGTASFSYDEQAKELGHLRLAVDTTSLVGSTSQIQSDLAMLLGTAQYPEIRFTAMDRTTFADGKGNIKGTLTLRGVSKPVTLEATLNSGGKSARGAAPLGLSLHGTIKRLEFGMSDEPDTPGRFGDTITLQMELQAIRQ
ncbi:MAG: YceI family protein [Pseudomonadota bacterium]|nr:YceI family protein [Pseudomonadota bacterium]